MTSFNSNIHLHGRGRETGRGWSESVEDDSTSFGSEKYNASITDRSIESPSRLATYVSIWVSGDSDRRLGWRKHAAAQKSSKYILLTVWYVFSASIWEKELYSTSSVLQCSIDTTVPVLPVLLPKASSRKKTPVIVTCLEMLSHVSTCSIGFRQSLTACQCG